MSHQPGDIRLRPPGVSTPKDVKLYPWAVSGNLEITEVETGYGADSVKVSKLLIIPDSGAGIRHRSQGEAISLHDSRLRMRSRPHTHSKDPASAEEPGGGAIIYPLEPEATSQAEGCPEDTLHNH